MSSVEQSQNDISLSSLAFRLMCAKGLAFVLSLALPLLLVRRLDQTQFGLYKQAFLVIGTAITILPLGFGMSAFYFLPREHDSQVRARIVFNILLFNCLLGGAALLILTTYPQVLARIFHGPALVDFGSLIGAVIFFWIFSGFLETVAIANQERNLSSLFIIGGQLSKGLFLMAAAVFFGSIRSLIISALLHSLLQSAVMLVYLNSRFRGFWFSFSWPMLRTQLSYALPYGVAGLLFIAQTDLHNYFVSNRFNAATFAVYSIGCLQLPLVSILSESMVSVMIPRISYFEKQNKRREIILLMSKVMRKLALVYFPLYAFLMVSGRELIVWLFTERYVDSWPIFAINLTLLPFYVILLDPIVRAYSEQRYFLLKLRVVLLFLLVAGLWFSVKHLGLVGVISVVVSITLFEHLIVTYRSGRILGVEIGDIALLVDVGKLALAALLAAIPAAIARSVFHGLHPFYSLAGTGVIFLLTYVSVILLLRVVTTEERELLWGKLSRLRFSETRSGNS